MSSTSRISIDLTASQPKKSLRLPKLKKPLNAFASTAIDDDEHQSKGDSQRSGVFPSRNLSNTTRKQSNVSIDSAQLATINALSICTQKTSTEINGHLIYDYDVVWDDMKCVDQEKKKMKEIEGLERRPRYMDNLLASAEMRKRTQLSAKMKMLRKEREAEGEEFQHRESFVTRMYKKQQEDLREFEDEEKIHEETLNKPGGMSTFHRNMLNEMESKYDIVMNAVELKGKAREKLHAVFGDDDAVDVKMAESEKARHFQAMGTVIDINEEGQVVDRSQLLSGGLNITKTNGSVAFCHTITNDTNKPGQTYHRRGNPQQDSSTGENITILDQLAQARKRVMEEERQSRADMERQSKSRKTETDIKSAKERYLERKAAAARQF